MSQPTTLNIALLTPSDTSYSETFINAHKKYLKGNIFHYYGSIANQYLDGFGPLRGHHEFKYRIKRLAKRESHTRFLERFVEDSFKKNKIEVVLAEYGDTAISYLPILKRLKLPLVVHFHGYDASIYKMFDLTNNYKEIFEYATYIVVVSQEMRSTLLEKGCPDNKLVYNVYGPREEFLKIQPEYSKQQIVAAGRFVDKKAPYYLILAFKEVIKVFPEAKLVIGGDGDLFQACRNLIRHYKLEENVLLPGVISSQDLQDYFKVSIAFVQHSITALHGDSEGTPLTILEASAAGLPVVSTIHGGIPDVIIDGETGLLCDEHDVEAMTNNLIQVLNDRNLVKRLGMQGKKRIKENFTLNRHLDILDSLLTEAAGNIE